MMTRMIFAAIAALAGVFFGLQPAQAYEAPWCAVVNKGKGNMYWDCQYSSDDCYRRGTLLAGNRGFCNHSPYYVAGYAEQRQTRKRHARPQ